MEFLGPSGQELEHRTHGHALCLCVLVSTVYGPQAQPWPKVPYSASPPLPRLPWEALGTASDIDHG